MSLKSVNDILGVLALEAKWEEQPFQRLLKCWSEVVPAVVAANTRPLSIERGVLRVATSSAAWAQNLTFERQRLLLKLNEKLPDPLVDIRFSTAQWQRPKAGSPQQTVTSQQHPSYVGDRLKLNHDVTSDTLNPNAAFDHWARVVQARSRGLPLCQQCECPTPEGELQRWGVCSLCAAKRL